MKINSLQLKNFRQFKDEKIIFSIDDEKNVTLINGENGSGKTTFLQSFFWCFYGKTGFKNEYHLNTQVKNSLKKGDTTEVKVIVELTYVNDYYLIETSQEFYKRAEGEDPQAKNIDRNIYTKENGNLVKLDKMYVDSKINEIMPEKLSRYFFFDGEDISSLGKEVSSNNKSKSFEEAVAGLLGYKPFQEAMEILKPQAIKHSVIANYENQFKKGADEELKEISLQIEKITGEILEYDKKINYYEHERINTEKRRNQKLEEMKKTSEGKILQEEKAKYEELIRKNNENLQEILGIASKNLSTYGWLYFSEPLISKSLSVLDHSKDIIENLPDIHWNTIKFILDKEECICGRILDEEAREHLSGLKEFLPPESTGLSIKKYREISSKYLEQLKSSGDMYSIMRELAKKIHKIKNENLDFMDKIRIIDEKLLEFEETEKLQKEYEEAEEREKEIIEELNILSNEKGKWEQQKNDLEDKKTEINMKNSENRKIEIYKSYAVAAYELISNTYKKYERDKRIEFEKEINNFYRKEFFNDCKIEIDDKYRISVYDESTGKKEFVDTSTGQSVAIVFSFIAAILTLIQKEKMSSKDADLSFTEPLPLLMDAPISTFDTERIENFSKSMPKMAEQMIIFLKDTEGEKVKDYIGYKIGKEYSFDKIHLYETKIIID